MPATRSRSRIFQDTPTSIQIGAPFKLDFKVETAGENFIVKTTTLRVFGRGGEEYATHLRRSAAA